MLGTKTIKIHNIEKIVGGVFRHRSPTAVHWALESVVTGVEETEHLYIFTINTQYEDMVGQHHITLIRHGGIWDSMPYTPLWTMRDGRGEKIDMLASDIRDKRILLKRMRQLMEIGV